MKKSIKWFPKKTVGKIVKIMDESSSDEEVRRKLSKKFHFNQHQIDFIMTFTPESLLSEENYQFSPYYNFINVLNVLNSNEITNRCAVIVDKVHGGLYVYEKAIAETKPGDSYFKFLESLHQNDCLRLVFTNNGQDRYFLDVFTSDIITENEVELRIHKADKIIWNGLYWIGRNQAEHYTVTYEISNYIVIETIKFKGDTTVHKY